MERTVEEELKAHLLSSNDEFRTLSQQHSDYDRQLQALEAKDRLSYEEQMEEVRLKKMKLRAKDRMMEIIHRHSEHVH